MREQIDLVVVAEEPKKPGRISLAGLISAIVHAALILWFVFFAPREAAPVAKNVPMLRYVELIKNNPREFTEAPGPETGKAPLNAPFSDKNRKASMPEPTGLTPTNRPGDGRGAYTPAMPPPGPRGVQPQQPQMARQPQQPSNASPSFATTPSQQQPQPDDTFIYREPTQTARASAATGPIDWKSAIKAVRGPVGGNGADGFDFGQAGGGELGTADQGPLSFETQWYDWGPYAQSMVSRIRVNWYANMPPLIRTGIKGVVTIRFTIERDGRITDITILKSSGHPPYDFAARKAIELSSPLNPLPKDFPNSSERVTAMFYYNTPLP